VLVEAPSYPHALDALRAAGARLVPVAVDAVAGWDHDLEPALARTSPALAYLVPDFQNPTGCRMPAARRSAVLQAVARQATVLVVDETTADLAIDPDERFPPLGVDAPAGATVVHVGSVGKSVWGGLRVGWIRGPRPLLARLVAARTARDLGTPVLDQLLVVELWADLDDVLAARARDLGLVRDHVEAVLAAAFPEWTVPHVRGGLATWVNLGRPVSSRLALAARSHGLLLAAGPRFGLDGAFERHLRVPITYPLDVTARALDALAAAWADLGAGAGAEEPELAGVL
jgi:DNA-binding transcriptional MocR family regulator